MDGVQNKVSVATPRIEVCFSPVMYPAYHNPEAIVVVTDVLRASSAIVTALMNGALSIIPVETIQDAKEFKSKGYLVAAERDGIKLEFADLGNSPFNFTSEKISGKQIVYSTTNGTQAIHMAREAHQVIVGAFINLNATCNYLSQTGRDIIILCAGWKNRFSLEDTVHAGAIVERILQDKRYSTICDSALAALDLWQLAKPDVRGYLEKCAQRSRLRKNKLDDVIDYCFTPDLTEVIPVFKGGQLVDIQRKN